MKVGCGFEQIFVKTYPVVEVVFTESSAYSVNKNSCSSAVPTPPWAVRLMGSGLCGTLYCSGTDERNFKVINCQANELVIENEGIVYYMRKMQR